MSSTHMVVVTSVMKWWPYVLMIMVTLCLLISAQWLTYDTISFLKPCIRCTVSWVADFIMNLITDWSDHGQLWYGRDQEVSPEIFQSFQHKVISANKLCMTVPTNYVWQKPCNVCNSASLTWWTQNCLYWLSKNIGLLLFTQWKSCDLMS